MALSLVVPQLLDVVAEIRDEAGAREALNLQGALLGVLLAGWGLAYLVGRLRVGAPMMRIPRWIYPPPYRTVVREAMFFAQARLTRAQLELGGRLVGVFFALGALQIVAVGDPVILVFVPIGFGVAFLAPLAIRRWSRADLGPTPPRERHWVREGRDPIGTSIVLAGSVVAAAIGVLGLALSVAASSSTDDERAAPLVGEWSDDERIQLAIVVMIVGFGSSWALFWLGRHLANRHAAEVLARDPRPPVLLLRSFGDDDLQMRVTPASRHSFAGRIGLQRAERFEEVLAWSLAPYGPVTAVAEPGQRVRPLGAAREELRAPDWFAAVTQRMAGASLVVLVAGVSRGPRGEVGALRSVGVLERTLFVIPPVPLPEAAWRWAAVAAALGDGVVPQLPPHQPSPLGAVVAVRDGCAVHYTGIDRRDVTYEAAIDLAIADLVARSAASAGPGGQAF